MTRLRQQPNLISRRLLQHKYKQLASVSFLASCHFKQQFKTKAPHLNRVVFLFVNLVTSQFYYITVAVTTSLDL